MSDDVNKRIEILDHEIRGMRGPLVAAHTDFVRAAAAWAKEFWPKQVEAVVTAYPDKALQHGVEGLRKLKADLAALVQDADVRTVAHFGDATQEYWPHLHDDLIAPRESADISTGSSHFHPRSFGGPLARQPKVLADHGRLLLGEVAGVLRDHDFPTTRWDDHDYRSYASDGREYHQHAWSEGMLTAIGVYAQLHDTLRKTRDALANATRERDKGEAKSLWDQA
jgi:hypothetical protein